MKSSNGESANSHDYHTKISKKSQALNVTKGDDNHLNLTKVEDCPFQTLMGDAFIYSLSTLFRGKRIFK